MTTDAHTQQLQAISADIRARLSEKDATRDAAVRRSREVIRLCSECIRAIHRSEWAEADAKLESVRAAAGEMRDGVALYPDLYHSGYTQDALKEVVEAFLTSAIIRHEPLPTPDALEVEDATYLNGMAEAATELRRYILDIMRREEMRLDEAERLLRWMDAIYDQLVTFDFPDAITGGLRRQTDIVRGVLERTRGDLTTSARQLMLQEALGRFELQMQRDSGK